MSEMGGLRSPAHVPTPWRAVQDAAWAAVVK